MRLCGLRRRWPKVAGSASSASKEMLLETERGNQKQIDGRADKIDLPV